MIHINFGAKVATPGNFRMTLGTGTENKYVVTAVTDNGEESVASNEVSSNDGSTFAWNSVAGADYYNIYKDSNRSGFFGWIGQANELNFSEPSSGIIADMEKSYPIYKNYFDGEGKYPGVVMFFEQRLIYARSNEEPQTVWGSVTASFENMNISSPLRADDSYSFTLNASQVNEIRTLTAINDLIIGSSGGEWRMSAGSGSDAITPSSVKVTRQSQWGSSHLVPIIIGNTVIFVEGSGTVVRDLLYSLEQDGYTGADLSLLASHLMEDQKIISWSYQQFPDSIIWCVRSDGVLLGLTYYRDHKIFGWHKQITDGKFLDVCSVRDNDGNDETYFIIEREINGLKKQYIEKFTSRNFDNDIKNAFFVDCGLTYKGAAVKTISGLDHLEGKTVVALADGNVIKNLTVTGGSVAIMNASEIIHIGLPFESKMETLDIEFPVNAASNTAQNIVRSIKTLTIRLKDTRGLFVGPDMDNLVEVPFRTNEPLGEPIKLFSGDKKVNILTGSLEDARVVFYNADPVPVSLLSFVAEVEYAGA